MKKITLLLILLITSVGYAQTPEGTWKLTPSAGALSVGPSQGSSAWFSNSAADVTTRACLFDDEYEFKSDASFNNIQGGSTWLEGWQGATPEACGTPVAPHDGSNAATWSYDSGANSLTINGTGAYVGLAKAVNAGELSSATPPSVPTSITYIVTSVSATNMTLDIEAGTGVWWRFQFTKNGAVTEPATGATDPTHASADVISMFSGVYTDVTVDTWRTAWSSGSLTEESIAGNDVKKYTNMGFVGVETTSSQIDVTTMTHFNLDYWTLDATTLKIKLVDFGPNGAYQGSPNDDTEHELTFTPTSGSWQTLSIPLSDFTGLTTKANLAQYIFSGSGGSTIYIDNVYFSKPASSVDATLSDLKVDGTTIAGFGAGTETYTYGLVEGTATVPTVTATTTDAGATITSITPASAIPGATTVLVTAADGTTTKTYTVNFVIDTPAAGAPDPTIASADVISMFSGVYTDEIVDTWRTGWSNGTLTDVMIAGNDTKKYTSMVFVGVETTSSQIDASTMTHFNFDYWTPDATSIKIKLVDFGPNGAYQGSPNDDTEHELTFTTTTGSWQTLSIPLSDFTGLTTTSNMAQYIFSLVGGSTVYIDNVYFHKTSAVTWDGSDSTDWDTAANWSSGSVPTVASNVTIPSAPSNQPVIGSTTGASVNDLTVDAGASLSITSGGSIIVAGTSSGDITYNLAIADTNWHLVASPVVGEGYDDAYVTANSIASGSVSASNRGIATYDNGTPDVTTMHWRYMQSGGTGTFDAGIGYSMLRTAAGDYSFTGTFPTADVSPAISQNNQEDNLIGNPYPSYLDVAAFLTANSSNITGTHMAVYVYDGAAYTGLTTGYIHPGQAFFVNSNVASGTAIITEAMQSHNTGSFYRTSNTAINLTISNETSSKETQINYLDGKTTSLDPRFDVAAFTGVSSNLNVFTQLLEGHQEIGFERQALPNTDLESMIIPVGVKADGNQEITFSADVMNLPSGLMFFLEDRESNTFTRLDEANTEYSTTLTDALNGTGRFYMHTSRSSLGLEDLNLNSVNIYKSGASTLRIVGLPQGNTSVSIYNIQGQEMLSKSFEATSTEEISLPKLSTGIYIIDVQTATGKISEKIILE